MQRPSAPLVISCLALFVALGGTSYAVSKLPRNSVGTAQLKNNAVNSAKVKNGSLLAADFKAGQLPAGAKGEVGAQGAIGPIGPAGPNGLDGADGLNGAAGVSGPTGATGANGQQGATGPTGGGLLGNAFAVNAASVPIDSNPVATVVTRLSEGPGYSSGPLVVPVPTRYYVAASVNVSSAADGTLVICSLLSDPGPPITVFPGQAIQGIGNTGKGSLTITAASELEPGTYDMAVSCRTDQDPQTATVTVAFLTVLAVQQVQQ